jgi:hypothetical protein
MAGFKFLFRSGGTISEKSATQVSAGAGNAGDIPALDGTGRLDSSMMPTGIGADTAAIVASEALSAGDLVNVWSNAGTAAVRKADASTTGKEAHGFVQAAFASAATATVYFEGTDTQLSGLTPGVNYLSATTPGRSSATPPSTVGQTVQVVGFATSATALNFQSGTPISLG